MSEREKLLKRLWSIDRSKLSDEGKAILKELIQKMSRGLRSGAVQRTGARASSVLIAVHRIVAAPVQSAPEQRIEP